MSTTTTTIKASQNPTYGGRIRFDGLDYSRKDLSEDNPDVGYDLTNTERAFAFFDLSTDPTGGGTITKVELLGTVSSVGGTHAVDIHFRNSENTGGNGPGVDPAFLSDADLYSACATEAFQVSTTPSAGALVVDLGADAIAEVGLGIAPDQRGFFVGIVLSNEAAAGSVVFDAATGFGLRITYTAAASGVQPGTTSPYSGFNTPNPYQGDE